MISVTPSSGAQILVVITTDTLIGLLSKFGVFFSRGKTSRRVIAAPTLVRGLSGALEQGN